ncbi:uncharacterized protein [Acropora muricata]|uniref:uncharacterized protein isoform X1 n=1 Tax=Acropora muricata TaxID=159855 RepID=UPI0034E5A4BE
MESPAMIFFALFVFTVITSVNSAAPFIKDEDEATAIEIAPEKRAYTYNGRLHCYQTNYYCRCRANYQCSITNYGFYRQYRCCRRPSTCSSCSASQCCLHGRCQALKTYLQWCPRSAAAKRYNCGCANGLKCLGDYYYHYGKCHCSSNAVCGASRCCSNNSCKPLKKPGEACPLKGADIYNCGCVQGFECKPAGFGRYWGKCVEESGSGMGANVIS